MKKVSLFMWYLLVLIFVFCGAVKAEDEQCKLYLDITFKENLLFDKYDVLLCLDDKEIGMIKYAQPFTYLTDVKKGKHTITFYKSGNRDICGTETITVKEDCTYRCKIQTDGKKVNIVNSEQEATLEGSSIVIPDLELLFAVDAVRKLEEVGITKIKLEDEQGHSASKDKNWIVIKQSVKPTKKLDKNDEIVLTCKVVEEFLSEHFLKKSIKDAITEAEKIQYEIAFINRITDMDMRNYLLTCSDEEIESWEVEKINPVKSDQKLVQLFMSYTGERIIPNVKGMSLKHAIMELHLSGFDNLMCRSEEGDTIKERDTEKWKVIFQSVEPGETIGVKKLITLKCRAYDSLLENEIFSLTFNANSSSELLGSESVEELDGEQDEETEIETETSTKTEPEEAVVSMDSSQIIVEEISENEIESENKVLP